MQLKRSVTADNDLIEIYQYAIETYGKVKAESYFAELIDAMVIISESPYIYRERTEFVSPVRIARAGQHLVVYSIEENYRIRVMTHCACRLPDGMALSIV